MRKQWNITNICSQHKLGYESNTPILRLVCSQKKGGVILREVCGITSGNKAVLIPFAMIYWNKEPRSKYLKLLIICHNY